EKIWQRLRADRGWLRQVLIHLLAVFLPALCDLVLEKLRERAVAESLLALLRMVHDEIRHERPREPARFLLRILHHERIHGAERAGHAPGRRADWRSRGSGGGGSGGRN